MRKILKPLPEEGDTRVKEWFALFPETLPYKDSRQRRWLEKVRVQQFYGICVDGTGRWFNLEFVDD